ncbi:MAG: helix-turn-helix domain-containing protein [Rhodobacterales bacterium]|nr:helix-turn-helix domain-containing protein [Rhodobacterales bacterium]
MANRTDLIASLGKGLRVLESFGADRPRQSITDVAAITGLDRATARRCLLTLSELGYADYDGKFFTLTPRVLRLGTGALAALPLPQIVQPWLDQLSEQIGQSCSVAILDEIDILYVARAAQRRVMSIGLMPGSRLPAHCTSLGRVLLAALPGTTAQEIVERSNLSPRTVHSRVTAEEVLAEIARVRTQGWALVDQEVELGLRSLAVPVLDMRGRVVAALNCGMAAVPADPAETVATVLPALLKVQDGLRRVLR